MTPLRRTPVAVRAYAAGLWLCPPSFRRQYADEMRRDFVEARAEAIASRRRGAHWHLGLQMSVDLARTVAIQWARTGAILVAIGAMACALTLAAALASLARRIRFDVPPHVDQIETFLVVVMISVVVVVIASTIIFTQWFAASIRRRPRRPRPY